MTKTQTITPRLLRLRDAAQYLSLSPWKVRNLVQTGELRAIGGEGAPFLLDIRDLDNWIDRSKRRFDD